MKLISKKKVEVKEIVFGGGGYIVCAGIKPVDAAGLSDSLREAEGAVFDVLEMDISDYRNPENLANDLMASMKQQSERPVILHLEFEALSGDFNKKKYIDVLTECAENQCMDIIDVETDDYDFIQVLKKIAEDTGLKLILTYRNFEGVNDENEVFRQALKLQNMGADIIRVMYLATDDVEVLKIAKAAKIAAGDGGLIVPFCISAIGEAGLMMRILGDRCGNDFGTYRLSGTVPGNEFENLDEYRRLKTIYKVD